MKTREQLFKAAKKGPNIEYNTLLQILESVTDTRNCVITAIMENQGEEVTAMKAEIKKVYQEEIKNRENR